MSVKCEKCGEVYASVTSIRIGGEKDGQVNLLNSGNKIYPEQTDGTIPCCDKCVPDQKDRQKILEKWAAENGLN